MWRQSESTERPLDTDEMSSKDVVYVRRNITQITIQDEIDESIRMVYRYEENTVPKSDWETYKKVIENENAMIDTQLAICDLYEMITGGASNG